MITKSKVINLITKNLPDAQVKVENLKGNDHLQVTVISSSFNGLSLVKQHQLVYSCLLYTSPSPRDQSGSRMPSSA